MNLGFMYSRVKIIYTWTEYLISYNFVQTNDNWQIFSGVQFKKNATEHWKYNQTFWNE